MKIVRHLLTLAGLLLAAGPAQAYPYFNATIGPGWTTGAPPPPFWIVSAMGPVEPSNTAPPPPPGSGETSDYPEVLDSMCWVTMSTFGPKNSSGWRTVGNVHREMGVPIAATPRGWTFSCFGVHFKPEMTADEVNAGVRQIFSRPLMIPADPVWQRSTADGAFQCGFILYVQVGLLHKKTYASTGFDGTKCRSGGMAPIPVACIIQAPDTINHRTTEAGRVKSQVDSSVWVSCTEDSQVSVEVMDTSMELSGVSGKISANLYVGATGQRITRVHATPNVIVPLISDIDVATSAPGAYEGSKIILVTWD